MTDAEYVREVERLVGGRVERDMALWLRREGLDPREAASELAYRSREDRPFDPEERYPVEAKPHHFAVNPLLPGWRRWTKTPIEPHDPRDVKADVEQYLRSHGKSYARDGFMYDTSVYTKDEWRKRGEKLGNNAIVSIASDGPLTRLLNGHYHLGPTEMRDIEELNQFFESLGLYAEQGFAWSIHLYAIGGPEQSAETSEAYLANPLDEDDDGACVACHGELVYLGQLGRLQHYRCRRCGLEQSVEAESTDDPTGERARGRREGELEDPDDEFLENRRKPKWKLWRGKKCEKKAPSGQSVRLGTRGGQFRWWMTSKKADRSFPVGPIHETLKGAMRYAEAEGYR